MRPATGWARTRSTGCGTIPSLLLADVDLPPNFGISHTPIAEQLADTDLLLTVSSTACLEAAGRPAAGSHLPLDLGVHEKLGNHVFLDSGLFRTFDQIIADDPRATRTRTGWPTTCWPSPTPPAVIIADRAEELLASGERPSSSGTTVPLLPDRGGLQSRRGPPAAAVAGQPADRSGRLAAADGRRQSRRTAAGSRPAGPPARLHRRGAPMTITNGVRRPSLADIPGWFFWVDRRMLPPCCARRSRGRRVTWSNWAPTSAKARS